MSLEELNYIFGVPSRQHISYQLRHVVPWALSVVRWAVLRYALRKESKKPESPQALYSWVDIKSVEKAERKKTREEERRMAVVEVDRVESTGSGRQQAEPRKSMDVSSAS